MRPDSEPIIPALLPRDRKRAERERGRRDVVGWGEYKREVDQGEGERESKREPYVNPFNRESIYITDLPNNNSVSSARRSRIIPHHLAIGRSRTSHRCLLPISGSTDEYYSEFRSPFPPSPASSSPPGIERICATWTSALKGPRADGQKSIKFRRCLVAVRCSGSLD